MGFLLVTLANIVNTTVSGAKYPPGQVLLQGPLPSAYHPDSRHAAVAAKMFGDTAGVCGLTPATGNDNLTNKPACTPGVIP